MPRLKPRDLFFDYHLLYTGTEIEEVVEEITDIVKENLKGRMRDRKESAQARVGVNLETLKGKKIFPPSHYFS